MYHCILFKSDDKKWYLGKEKELGYGPEPEPNMFITNYQLLYMINQT